MLGTVCKQFNKQYIQNLMQNQVEFFNAHLQYAVFCEKQKLKQQKLAIETSNIILHFFIIVTNCCINDQIL